MKAKRYFVESDFSVNNIARIEGEEYHHMKDVMRSRVGDDVVLINGTTLDAYGKIITLNKNYGEVLIEKIENNKCEPSVEVVLYQAVCKGDKLSLITQKITELGASKMVVFYSDFTDIKDKTNRLEKLEKVSVSAIKQCGRSKPIKISGVLSFENMVEDAKKLEKVFVAYENASGITLYQSLSKNANFTKIGVIIGAEGGFSAKEVEILEKNFEIVSLGKRILRTETASIVSVAEIIGACEK